MPQKDYVKTARPKPKAKTRASTARRGNARTTQKKSSPWILLIITALLLSSFGGFLWYLTQQPESQQKPVATAKKGSTPAVDELPAKPVAEPYQYIKDLENKEVHVDVNPTEREPQGPYQMQCGSFRQAEQAEAMRAQIAFAGFASSVRRTDGGNGVWYRVVLGPYDSKRQATADRNRLQQQNINGCQIWNWT